MRRILAIASTVLITVGSTLAIAQPPPPAPPPAGPYEALPPPAGPYETVPPPPGTGYVWVLGHWH